MSDFWSRRKSRVAAEEAVDAREAALAEAAQAEAVHAEKTDAEVLAELDLPDPDTLSLGDDFKPYLAKAIPARIRNRALRRLWRSNPVLACVDGLNDYDDDYTTASVMGAAVKTAYRVGKGMQAHVDELARQADAKMQPEVEIDAKDEGESGAEAPDDAVAQAADPQEAAPIETALAETAPVETADADAPVLAIASRRHMSFSFDAEEVS